jgi:hypothetical protein
MRRYKELLGAFEIAGITCGLECREEGFGALLASRYAKFASDAPPEICLSVELTPPPPADVVLRWSGPFARVAGSDGVLSIEGAGFRGHYDERSGQGWIAQPPDPAPVETFLTAICAGRLLRAGGFFLHAAALVGEDGARVFFGPSGSGKTTVAGLVGEGVITDETAAIRPSGGGYRVSGVPWRGQPLSAPLAGLFRLRKASDTSFIRLSPVEAVRQLLPSVLFARPDAPEIDRFLEIAGDLVTRVPCYEMRFTPDRSFWEGMPGRQQRERHDVAL